MRNSMEGVKFSRPLTVTELERICRHARQSKVPLQSTTVYFFHRIGGVAWPLRETLDPTAYRIPSDQWGAISSAITAGYERLLNGKRPDGFLHVAVAMEWMNIGPSGDRELKPMPA